jgi:hypothetical protein
MAKFLDAYPHALSAACQPWFERVGRNLPTARVCPTSTYPPALRCTIPPNPTAALRIQLVHIVFSIFCLDQNGATQ